MKIVFVIALLFRLHNMSVLQIVYAPDSQLIVKSSFVEEIDDKIRILVADMFETLEFHRALGLAAVQVGCPLAIFIMKIKDYYDMEFEVGYEKSCEPIALINPRLIEVSDERIIMTEGCLSFPEQHHDIERPSKVSVEYTDINGMKKILKAQNWLARCILHEMEHLHGNVFIRNLHPIKQSIAMDKAKQMRRKYSRAKK